MCRLQGSDGDCYSALLDGRLAPRLTPAQRRALQRGGARGLAACLEEEHEEALPEIRRSRPKARPCGWEGGEELAGRLAESRRHRSERGMHVKIS